MFSVPLCKLLQYYILLKKKLKPVCNDYLYSQLIITCTFQLLCFFTSFKQQQQQQLLLFCYKESRDASAHTNLCQSNISSADANF